MNINLSKFKKTHEDEHSATLQHSDGHEIKIAKKSLSKGMQKELSKLPQHLDAGGMAYSNEDELLNAAAGPEQMYSPSPEQKFQMDVQARAQEMKNQQAFLTGRQINADVPPEQLEEYAANDLLKEAGNRQNAQKADVRNIQENNLSQQSKLKTMHQHDMDYWNQQNEQRKALGLSTLPAPMPPQGLINSEEAPTPAGSGPQTSIVGSETPVVGNVPHSAHAPMDGYQQQVAGLQAQANAESAAAKQTADAYQYKMDQDAKDMADYQAKRAPLEAEANAVYGDYKNQHIDPGHFMGSLSTGQRISTAIGLMLGGLSGGMTRQGGNMALDYLNKQIENDINSQKENLNKTGNLLTANYKQLGNLNDAMTMTRINHLDRAHDEIAQIAAKSQDPIVQARAKQQMGLLQQDRDQRMHALTISQLGSSGNLPASMQGELPAELRERSVKLPNGSLAIAASKEDAEKSRNELATLDELESGINDIKDHTKGTTFSIPGVWQSENETLLKDKRKMMALNIRKWSDITRASPEITKEFEEALPYGGEWRQDLAKKKAGEFLDMIMRKKQAVMSNLLMGNQVPTSSSAPPMAPPNLSGMKKK